MLMAEELHRLLNFGLEDIEVGFEEGLSWGQNSTLERGKAYRCRDSSGRESRGR